MAFLQKLKARVSEGMTAAREPDAAPEWERVAVALFGLAIVIGAMIIHALRHNGA